MLSCFVWHIMACNKLHLLPLALLPLLSGKKAQGNAVTLNTMRFFCARKKLQRTWNKNTHFWVIAQIKILITKSKQIMCGGGKKSSESSSLHAGGCRARLAPGTICNWKGHMSLLMHFLEKTHQWGPQHRKTQTRNIHEIPSNMQTDKLLPTLTTYTSTAYQTESWGTEAAACIMIRG